MTEQNAEGPMTERDPMAESEPTTVGGPLAELEEVAAVQREEVAGAFPEAPEAEQDYRAALLYSQAGSSPWPVCGA